MAAGTMWRDQLSVGLKHTDGMTTGTSTEQPCIVIVFDGPMRKMVERLKHNDREGFSSADLEVHHRFQASEHPQGTSGVLAITDRVNGEYVLEVNTSTEFVEEFVSAMTEYMKETDTGPRYRVEARASGKRVASFETELFLVYEPGGQLLRSLSLVPDGIEI